MHVTAIWRYPVKSLQGERLERAVVGPLGLEGDRSWGLCDLATGHVLTARREPALLMATGVLDADGSMRVRLPDGTVTADDAALSAWLGRDVALVEAGPEDRGVFENPADAEDEAGEWLEWEGPPGTYHDSGRTQVSLLGDTRLDGWDPRRFRANVLVDADERSLLGRQVQIGSALLHVVKEVGRCVMVTRPQPGGIERDVGVLRTINAWGGHLAVGAVVVEPGELAVGDELHVRPT